MSKYIVCSCCHAAVAAVGSAAADGVLAQVALSYPTGCPYCRRASDNGSRDPQASPAIKAVHDAQNALVAKEGGSRNCFQVLEE